MSISEQEVARELADLKARLRAIEVEPPAELTPLQKAIADVNANWHVSGRLRPPENPSMRRRIMHFAKRAARRVLVELLDTIVEQQNAFNAQVARALTELAKENDRLRERIDERDKERTNQR